MALAALPTPSSTPNPTTPAPDPTPTTPIAANDAVIGTWQNGSRILDVVANGSATVVTKVDDIGGCLVGAAALQGIGTTGTAGTYGATANSECFNAPGGTLTLVLAGDRLTIGSQIFTRLPATALAADDPLVGSWQKGKTINVVGTNGAAHFGDNPVKCRVGQLDSYGLTPVPGPAGTHTYTVNDGEFGRTGGKDDCTARSFTRKLTLTVRADGKLQIGNDTANVWTKTSAPTSPNPTTPNPTTPNPTPPTPTTAPIGANDGVVGTWQSGQQILDVVANGSATVIATTDAAGCPVGSAALTGIGVTATAGTYGATTGGSCVGGAGAGAGVNFTVAGDQLTLGAQVFTRLPATALAAGDPLLGSWQRGGVTNAVDTNGAAHFVDNPVKCRVGQLDSYGLTPVPGPAGTHSYTVKDGEFGRTAGKDDCTARSFTRKLTLTVRADGKLQIGNDAANVWTKVSSTPPGGSAVIPKERNQVIVLDNNVNSHWVRCALIVFDKNDEVQALLAQLKLDTVGVHQMDQKMAGDLDAVLGKGGNDFKTDVYQPFLDAMQQAGQLPTIGGYVPANVSDKAQDAFKAGCVRRT